MEIYLSWISLASKSPCLLKLPPTNLELFASFFSLSLPSVYRSNLQTNSRRATQENKGMSLGKEAATGEILSWPLTSLLWGVAHILDACGSLHEYRMLPKLAALMCLLEKLYIVHCGKKRKTNDCCRGLAFTAGSLASHQCPTRG